MRHTKSQILKFSHSQATKVGPEFPDMNFEELFRYAVKASVLISSLADFPTRVSCWSVAPGLKKIPMDDLGATVPYLIKSCNLQNTIFFLKISDWSYRPAATNVR